MNSRSTSLSVFLFLSIQPWVGGRKNLPAKGDLHAPVFENADVRFSLGTYPNSYNGPDKSGVYRLVSRRVVLKKIALPAYKRNVSVNLKTTLASNNGRWDKPGSCFVSPRPSVVNPLTTAHGDAKFPPIDSSKLEKAVGIVPRKDYLPTVKLMCFMTSFSVGHYNSNSDSLSSKRCPVYILK